MSDLQGTEGWMESHFDGVRIDRVVTALQHLSGKPSPDTCFAAMQDCAVAWVHPSIFENALAGVDAARAGKFSFFAGVDRIGHADALRRDDADIVAADLDAWPEEG